MRHHIATILLCLFVVPVLAADDESCLKCHSDRDALAKARTDPARSPDSLLIDRDRYGRSVHASRGCGECHFDYDRHPHPKDAESVTCTECHDQAAEAFGKSVHAEKKDNPKLPLACRDCHGVHDVLKPTERDSRMHPLNIYGICGKCHFDVDPSEATHDELLHQEYSDDTHGFGILKAGLVVSATCVSCHGGHEIRHSGDPESLVARHRVDRTCGKCHLGALEEYRLSVHHLRSEGTEHKGATCTDCHRPHAIEVRNGEFRTQAVKACSNCHDQRGGSFRLTYHGKVSSLGYGGESRVATCDSCHGNHSIRASSDPLSWIHPNNKVETCAKCHKGSHEEFANYLVHADPADGGSYPQVHAVWVFMTGLLVVVLILGGLHALLWLIRATAAGEWKRPPVPKEAVRWIRRWPRAYVVYHMVMMTTVLVLSTTGLPIHYADKEWSRKLMGLFGGPAVTGYIHRFAAVILGLLFVVYLSHLAGRVWKREKGLFRGPDTMLPRWKDVQDFWGNVKWFLFLAPRPKYDRWTYWEKFDFWAAFWGLFVIGLSGLMLWFPVWWTRIVPGWFINAATVVHGIEALLDIAFIFTVHVFHANLRPDKFPMDTMFLTGRIREAEFRHERPLEYERAVAEGRMEALLAAKPARRTRIAAYIVGTAALGVGFFFVAMMVVAVLQNAG